MTNPSIIALIPARSGSKRVQNKNIKILGKHPLIAYSIASALESEIFDKIIVSTDSQEYAAIAKHYGAEVPFLRPKDYAGEHSPDFEWVKFTLERLKEQGEVYDCFSILRPTSPFRLPDTIRRAWEAFQKEEGIDSLRAVEKCDQHPAKMWIVRGNRMFPLLPLGPAEQPWFSTPYQSLPEVFVQNASLEIAWSKIVLEEGTIAGCSFLPFFTKEHEGFDVNTNYDWELAERLFQKGIVKYARISQPPYEVKNNI